MKNCRHVIAAAGFGIALLGAVIAPPAIGAPEEEGEETEEKKLEERMLEKGIQPFSVQALSQDQVVSKLVYSSIGVAYREKKEEIITPIVVARVIVTNVERRIREHEIELTERRDDLPTVTANHLSHP